MSYQCNSLASLNGQVESRQHSLSRGITEKHILELNATCQLRNRLPVNLLHSWLSIDQGKDTFAGCQPQLKLAPERGNTGQREPEQVDALHKEKPVTRRDAMVQNAQTTEVDNDRRAKVCNH